MGGGGGASTSGAEHIRVAIILWVPSRALLGGDLSQKPSTFRCLAPYSLLVI